MPSEGVLHFLKVFNPCPSKSSNRLWKTSSISVTSIWHSLQSIDILLRTSNKPWFKLRSDDFVTAAKHPGISLPQSIWSGCQAMTVHWMTLHCIMSFPILHPKWQLRTRCSSRHTQPVRFRSLAQLVLHKCPGKMWHFRFHSRLQAGEEAAKFRIHYHSLN